MTEGLVTTPPQDYPALRVHLESSDVLLSDSRPRRCRRAFKANTFFLTSLNPAQPILPQADSRLEAWVQPVASGLTTTADGFIASGVLNTPFVFLTLPPGTYNVQWTVWLSGTLATAVDANNMELITSNNANNFVAQAMCPAIAGYYPQSQVSQVTILAGQTAGHYLAVQPSPNTPTAASVYGAQIVATAVPAPVYIAANKAGAQAAAAGSSGEGILIPPSDGVPYPVNTTDQVWAAAAALPALVSVSALYEEYE